MEKKKLLKFYYHFQSEDVDIDVIDDQLTFTINKDLHFQPSEIKILDCVLHSRCQQAPQLTLHDTEMLQIAPEIFYNPLLNITTVSLFNSTAREQTVSSGTPIFSINFLNVSGIFAIRETTAKVIETANQNRDILNFAFLDIVTRMFNQVGKELDVFNSTATL